MKKQLLAGITLLALSTATIAEAQPCRAVRFEDLPAGSTYISGDVFVADPGVTLKVGDFVYTPGPCVPPVTSGFARVEIGGLACRTGQDMWLNNVTLDFDLRMPSACVDIHFGYYGGTVSLAVNGACVVAPDVWSLPAALGGLPVNVVPTGGGCGVIHIDGVVDALAIGGQEFYIDDVRFCPGCRLNCPAGDGYIVSSTSAGNRSPDLDENGTVNLTDFVLFSSLFLTPAYCGDFDCSGLVDLPDFVEFQRHFLHTGVNGQCCR